MGKREKTIFIEYFGDSPTTRVLDFFIENDIWDYSKSDIFRETGVARTTLQDVIEGLINRNIVTKTRTIGRADLYQLNRENPIVKEMIKFSINIVTAAAKAEILTAKTIGK